MAGEGAHGLAVASGQPDSHQRLLQGTTKDSSSAV
jgi:hypothetical protein